MKIIRARHLGMCFGVRDAVTLALEQERPVSILGDLVHNESILGKLRALGHFSARSVSEIKTGKVMITAHGTSDRQLRILQEKGLEVLEATCPLVRYAHQAAQQLVHGGYHPVIVGQRGHVEVNGITGDLENFDVVLEEADIDALEEHSRFGVMAQTTQPIDRVRRLVRRLEARFPRATVQFVDTVCRPTKDRQSAAALLARQCQVVIVIGGAHSNNTRELVATCKAFCRRVFHVQGEADLQAEWMEGADCIGLTAGTSTPGEIIDAVERRLQELSVNQPIGNL